MDSKDTVAIEDYITNVIRRCTDTPEASAHALRVAYKRHGLTPGDLQVIISTGDRQSVLSDYIKENRELRNENRRLKSVKESWPSWQEFVQLCNLYVDVSGKRWRNTVASFLGLTLADLAAYERQNRVPLPLFKRIETMPIMRSANQTDAFEAIAGQIIGHLFTAGVNQEHIASLLKQFLNAGDETVLHKVLDKTPPPKPPSKKSAGPQHLSILQVIIDAGHPLHCEEILTKCKRFYPRWAIGAVNARLSELTTLGLVVKDGKAVSTANRSVNRFAVTVAGQRHVRQAE